MWHPRTAEATSTPPSKPRSGASTLALTEPAAADPTLSGNKAAALARATAAGLPVVPGVVLTTATDDGNRALQEAWDVVSRHGERKVAVRSSSTGEDTDDVSMAGQFTTVLDVARFDDFVDAVTTVRADAGDSPMAVLVQPMLRAEVSGVLFGRDPVTGADRLVVEVVRGTAEALVGGQVSASRHVLGHRGRLLEAETRPDAVTLPPALRRDLATLARRAAQLFGGPQDIEWAYADGRLHLLQSRPITRVAGAVRGPILGPGPVAETFPDPLSNLEADLWVPPLRAGIATALVLAGAAGHRRVDRSIVVAMVGRRVAADLSLLDPAPKARWRTLLDPRDGVRRLRASWTTGRLRIALPSLAAVVVDRVDRELDRLPHPSALDDEHLLRLLERSSASLRSVHGHEVLAGALGHDQGQSVASAALDALTRQRLAGVSDDDAVAADPVILALTVPRIGPTAVLPAELPHDDDTTGGVATLRDVGVRESLRLRARWLQEAGARAAFELGRRLQQRDLLADPTDVRWLSLDELATSVRTGAVPADVADRRRDDADAPPLPARFRLAADGRPVAVVDGPEATNGRGAGGGRGTGVVGDRPGSVLVVAVLDPRLASGLAGRAGLVAETGSVLSHLAIVAREMGVPTVVGVADAVNRFPPGTRLLVDGDTGIVEEIAP